MYGYTTWVIHRRLPLWGTALACLAFCAVMYRAILGRDRVGAGGARFDTTNQPLLPGPQPGRDGQCPAF